MTHICVSNLTVIGSDNGLSPGRRQAIIWTNNVILWIRSLGTNFSEILIEFLTFWFKKMRLNVSSVKWRPFCLGLNVLRAQLIEYMPEFPVWCNYLSMTKTPAYDNAIICRCTFSLFSGFNLAVKRPITYPQPRHLLMIRGIICRCT